MTCGSSQTTKMVSMHLTDALFSWQRWGWGDDDDAGLDFFIIIKVIIFFKN